MHQKTAGWIFFSLLVSSSIVSTISYPNVIPTQNFQTGFVPSNVPSDVPQLPSQRQERKFAEKPNAIKKVALDDLSNDLETNQISDSNGEGFSWSSLLTFINSTPLTGMLMQLIFPPGAATGPNKSDSLDDNSVAPSPWANLLAAGLKILTAILGGGTGGEGIDKVDNGGSPMQGILTGVLTAVLGGRDPQQVNAIAKQAGEVRISMYYNKIKLTPVEEIRTFITRNIVNLMILKNLFIWPIKNKVTRNSWYYTW
ncbi:hypothetical protein WA026_009457 [Henosepilachna vigintioctopunctata]|uniref:Uncharacterized protein n=1 Tax=Henosepilachna vigintioctopunctata TaxID=420089 RepID=A0AAW1U4Z8_9CUCU